jgi:hypothetical protein
MPQILIESKLVGVSVEQLLVWFRNADDADVVAILDPVEESLGMTVHESGHGHAKRRVCRVRAGIGGLSMGPGRHHEKRASKEQKIGVPHETLQSLELNVEARSKRRALAANRTAQIIYPERSFGNHEVRYLAPPEGSNAPPE